MIMNGTTLGLRWWGVIFLTKFYFTESQSFASYLPKNIRINVCSIKLKTKMISLIKMEGEKISSFLLNIYAVHDL